MLRPIFVAALFFFLVPVQATLVWQNDYSTALELARLEKKPLLLFFNGSDWDASAMKMKHEILDSPSFYGRTASAFVYLEIDFPKYLPLSAATRTQNEELKKRFHVLDLPTLLMIDQNERVIAHISYLPESGDQFAAELLEIIRKDGELLCGLKEMEQASPGIEGLKHLYRIASELSSPSAIDRIVQKGIESEEPFFLLEKYRLLVIKGQKESPEAKQLRSRLVGLDVTQELEGGQTLGFTLALIDFQELCQKGGLPAAQARPLQDYLDTFGHLDRKNIWRIEMMIAELYLDADCWQEAFEHAQKAHDLAPEPARQEIAHSLDYIRSRPALCES